MNRHPSCFLGGLALALLVSGQAAATSDFRDISIIVATLNDVLEKARTGTTVYWDNPDTGNSGSVTIVKTYYREDETPCRDYSRTTDAADGTVTMTRGTGCRDGLGVWRLDEEDPTTLEKKPATPGESPVASTGTAADPEFVETGATSETPEPAEETATAPETDAPPETKPEDSIVEALPKEKPLFIPGRLPTRSN